MMIDAVWLSFLSLISMSASVIGVVILVSMMRTFSKILEVVEHMSAGSGAILTKVSFIEARLDRVQGAMRDSIRHISQIIEEFDEKLDNQWMRRWIKDEYENMISVSAGKGVSPSGMRTLWQMMLGSAVVRARITSLSMRGWNDESSISTMKKISDNIQHLSKLEFGDFFEDIMSIENIKETGTAWSQLHEICFSTIKHDFENFNAELLISEEKKSVISVPGCSACRFSVGGCHRFRLRSSGT